MYVSPLVQDEDALQRYRERVRARLSLVSCRLPVDKGFFRKDRNTTATPVSHSSVLLHYFHNFFLYYAGIQSSATGIATYKHLEECAFTKLLIFLVGEGLQVEGHYVSMLYFAHVEFLFCLDKDEYTSRCAVNVVKYGIRPVDLLKMVCAGQL